MALIVLGRTVCPICDLPLRPYEEITSLPPLSLPPHMAQLSDAAAHRRCLLASPSAPVLQTSLRDWWSELASRFGPVVWADGVLAFAKGSGHFVLCVPSCLVAIEDDVVVIPSIIEILESRVAHGDSPEPQLRYRMGESECSGSLTLEVSDPLQRLTHFRGTLRQDMRDKIVQVLERVRDEPDGARRP